MRYVYVYLEYSDDGMGWLLICASLWLLGLRMRSLLCRLSRCYCDEWVAMRNVRLRRLDRILHTCFTRDGWPMVGGIRYAVPHICRAHEGLRKRMGHFHHLYNISRLPIMYCVIKHRNALFMFPCCTASHTSKAMIRGHLGTSVIQIVYATCSIYTARRHSPALNSSCQLRHPV